jgi:hypothetical protein
MAVAGQLLQTANASVLVKNLGNWNKIKWEIYFNYLFY